MRETGTYPGAADPALGVRPFKDDDEFNARVTAEHRLWLATMRAQSWITEFGSTVHHARRLGRVALGSENPWDVVVGNDLTGWA